MLIQGCRKRCFFTVFIPGPHHRKYIDGSQQAWISERKNERGDRIGKCTKGRRSGMASGDSTVGTNGANFQVERGQLFEARTTNTWGLRLSLRPFPLFLFPSLNYSALVVYFDLTEKKQHCTVGFYYWRRTAVVGIVGRNRKEGSNYLGGSRQGAFFCLALEENETILSLVVFPLDQSDTMNKNNNFHQEANQWSKHKMPKYEFVRMLFIFLASCWCKWRMGK